MGDNPIEEKADPGFRIHHVDSASGEVTEVPPFTSPGEFFQMKSEGKISTATTASSAGATSTTTIASASGEGEVSYDGYTAIQQAHGDGTTAESSAQAMRKARMSNRVKMSQIDESKIGAMVMPGTPPPVSDTTTIAKSNHLSSVYDKIRSNKALANQDIEMGDAGEDERPDLNFTIYHVDSKTREERKVPQYTSPGEFLNSIEEEEAATNGATELMSDMRQPAANGIATVGETASSVIIDDDSDEKTLDGYQAIQTANSAPDRGEELRRMKEARMANRARASDLF